MTAGPPSADQRYLHTPVTQKLLERMDTLYSRCPEGVPHLFHKVGEDAWPIWWGEPGEKRNTLDDVGVRGRIWALSLLLYQYHLIPRSYRAAASRIVARLKETPAPDLEAIQQWLTEHERSPEEIVKLLGNLISSGCREGFPPLEAAERWLEMVARFTVLRLLETAPCEDQDEFLKVAFEMPARAPSALYRALYERVARHAGTPASNSARKQARGGTDVADMRALERAWVSQRSTILGMMRHNVATDDLCAERRYVMPAADERDDKDILRMLHLLQGDERILVVGGEPMLGKKTKVKGVLRSLAAAHDKMVFERTVPGEETRFMPVFATSAGEGNYRALVDAVAIFLHHYAQAEHARNNLVSEPSAPPPYLPSQFDEAVESIFARYGDFPALFVIADVDAFEHDRTRQAIRDTGIRRLIEAILSAHPENRLILTTGDDVKEIIKQGYFARPRDIAPVEIDPPTYSDLKSFMNAAAYGAFDKARYDDIDPVDATIRGDDLVALAAMLSLVYFPQTGYGRLDDTQWREIELFFEKGWQDRKAERIPIYHMLAQAIVKSGLAGPIALIAASHDGVREDSLWQLLVEWRDEDPGVDLPPDCAALATALSSLAKVAGKRFLRLVRIPRYDPDEYAPDETHGPDDLIWDMDPLVSHWLLRALAAIDSKHAGLVAASHRLIARIARRRGHMKKALMRAPLGSRVTEDASRDIQSFASLLASIPGTLDDQQSIGGPPLRISEDAIYAVGTAFNAKRALRFAVISLLKEDIDHDHRLSMIFDEDALRLDLYLLLLLPTGRPYPTKLKKRRLPDRLPAHLLSNVFDPAEVLELLSTIALSAFHAQRFDVLEGIGKLANDYIAHKKIPADAVPQQLVRLWCSEIDAHILRGKTFAGDKLGAALAEVERYMGHFADVRVGKPDTLAASAPLPRLKAYLRLLAREAELHGLTDPSGVRAKAAYDRLVDFETALSTHPGHHDPVVLSGRVARRYIRYLVSDAHLQLQQASAGTDATLAQVKALVMVNTARLRRFSGAERVGVMLDRARVAMVEARLATQCEATETRNARIKAQLLAACALTDAANRRAFSGSVSHASKLDVLAIQSEAHRRLVDAALDKTIEIDPTTEVELVGQALTTAGIAAHDLIKMAKLLKAAPAQGLGHWLEARSRMSEHRVRAEKQFHYRGKHHRDPLELARRALRDARTIKQAIGDTSLDADLAKASIELSQLRREAGKPD